jgi:hypothetical protein
VAQPPVQGCHNRLLLIYGGKLPQIKQQQQQTMTNIINFATATHAELEAAGLKVIVKKSQAKTRRTRKSVWGAKPMCNKAHTTPSNVGSMTEKGRDTMSN